HGFSGELGHMTIETSGKKCRCGNRGCWELYASEQALYENAKRFGVTANKHNQEIYLENLLLLAEKGDPSTIQLFDHIGKYLGIGLNSIVNIFNPKQVIIGNRMASAKKWVEHPISKRMDQTLWFQQKDLHMDVTGLSTHSSALGMPAFSIDYFFIHTLPKSVNGSSSLHK